MANKNIATRLGVCLQPVNLPRGHVAILPYLVFRGLANRLGRRIGSKKSAKEGER
jgi:hypothetical protein